MDYLCRDQLFTFAVSPGRFHSKAHIQELLDHARVVVADGPVFTPKGRAAEPCLRTEVAFERTIDGTIIERVNDLFDTRSLMHEKVYQCGCGPAPRGHRVLPTATPCYRRGWSMWSLLLVADTSPAAAALCSYSSGREARRYTVGLPRLRSHMRPHCCDLCMQE